MIGEEGQTTQAMTPAPEGGPVTRVVPAPPGRPPVTPPTPVLQSSDEVAGIIEALCKAQGKFGVVGKDRTAEITSQRGSYKYSYATLASVIAAIRPALNQNGIALVQSANIVNGERAVLLQVDTRFIHTTGQWLGSVLRLPLGDATPQGMGSLLTYLRRYGLSALAGVASEEDEDGALATATAPPTPPRESRTRTRPPQAAPSAEAPPATDEPPHPALENELPATPAPAAPRPRPRPPKVAHPAPATAAPPLSTREGAITQKDRNLLFKTATAMGWTEADVKSLLHQLFTYTSTSQLTVSELAKVIACIERPAENGVTFEQVEGQQVLVVKR